MWGSMPLGCLSLRQLYGLLRDLEWLVLLYG